jgi:hypothetical protein
MRQEPSAEHLLARHWGRCVMAVVCRFLLKLYDTPINLVAWEFQVIIALSNS